MNKIAINTFDVRLSYLTEKEIEQWNSLNQLARTLWFENTISGPDLEYSRFSVEIFKLYPHYCTWSHVPRQNGGYVLQNNSPDSTLTINADLMNGWWNIFKRLTNGKLTSTTRSANTFQLYKDYYQLPDSEIANTLSKNFGHNQGVWDTFLKYLNYVYTIGNLSPCGANPGGGLDLWTNKLSKLKQQWFDQESEIRQEIYNNHNSNNTVLAKWSPLLWQSYNSSDYVQNWKSFINDHFLNGYVDSAYQLLPLKFDLKDDNSIILSLNQLTEIIIKRGIDISNKVNKSISFDAIEHYSIIFE